MINAKCGFIFVIVVNVVFAQDCDNVCYKDVKNGLKRLEKLYSKPPENFTIPPIFQDVNSLINKTEDIIDRIPNVDGIRNKSLLIQDSLKGTSKTVKLLRNLGAVIAKIDKVLRKLEHKSENHQKALDECENANNLFKMLREDVSKMKEYGNNIIAIYEAITDRIDNIHNESLNLKNDLDALHISEGLFEKYVCNSKLQSSIENLIDLMNGIADELRSSFAEVIDKQLKTLENRIKEYEGYIEEIDKSLDEKMPETDLIVNDKTKLTLEDLKSQVEDLKEKLKNIKLDKTFEDILGDARRKLKQLVKEYELILNQIFSARTRDAVKEEIEKARNTLNLLKEKEALKIELGDIKRIVDTLKNNGVCFINETVTIED